MLEEDGIMFIQLNLSPAAPWEPTHFIPKYSHLASLSDLNLDLDGKTGASSRKREQLHSLSQGVIAWTWCQLTPHANENPLSILQPVRSNQLNPTATL